MIALLADFITIIENTEKEIFISAESNRRLWVPISNVDLLQTLINADIEHSIRDITYSDNNTELLVEHVEFNIQFTTTPS